MPVVMEANMDPRVRPEDDGGWGGFWNKYRDLWGMRLSDSHARTFTFKEYPPASAATRQGQRRRG